MKVIYVNADYTRVGFYQSVLEAAGISCFIRNAVANGITEIPIPIFYPTLCVLNDEDYPRAVEELGVIFRPAPRLPKWLCPKCGANVPGNFETCWRCEHERNEDEKANIEKTEE